MCAADGPRLHTRCDADLVVRYARRSLCPSLRRTWWGQLPWRERCCVPGRCLCRRGGPAGLPAGPGWFRGPSCRPGPGGCGWRCRWWRESGMVIMPGLGPGQLAEQGMDLLDGVCPVHCGGGGWAGVEYLAGFGGLADGDQQLAEQAAGVGIPSARCRRAKIWNASVRRAGPASSPCGPGPIRGRS
jgi:hypothetical protein